MAPVDQRSRARLWPEAAAGCAGPSDPAASQATLIDSRPAVHEPEADSAKKKKKGRKESDYFSAHDPVATAKKKAEKAEKAGRRNAEKS